MHSVRLVVLVCDCLVPNSDPWLLSCRCATHVAAFGYPQFMEEIHRWFYDAFGDAPRGDESLNEHQLKKFIGRMLTEAHKAGLLPKAAFFNDGSLAPHEVEEMIANRCVVVRMHRCQLLSVMVVVVGATAGTASMVAVVVSCSLVISWCVLPLVVSAPAICCEGTSVHRRKKCTSFSGQTWCLSFKAFLYHCGTKSAQRYVAGISRLLRARLQDCLFGLLWCADRTLHFAWFGRLQEADEELEYEEKAADGATINKVDYGYGTLAEAGLTPQTGSAMVQSTLGDEWSAVVDPASGNVYYVNAITKETSWEPPGGMAAYEP
jgi:hypothetical protein